MSHADNPVVLMVDDQEVMRSEMKHVLELNGYRVIDTDNGQDAAKRARYVYPDLLLVNLDVQLLYQVVAGAPDRQERGVGQHSSRHRCS